MQIVSRCVGLGMALVLSACGGGRSPDMEYPSAVLQEPALAVQAPIVDLGDFLHVGADVAPNAGQLPAIGEHDGAEIRYGVAQDGVGAAQIVAYLQADSEVDLGGEGEGQMDGQVLPLLVRFGHAPPTVRVAEGTAADLVDEAVRVVQLINAALPRHWQLAFSPEPVPAGTFDVVEGEIRIQFAAQEDWLHPYPPPVSEGIHIGLAEPLYQAVGGADPELSFSVEIAGGRVWVDPTRTSGKERLGVIAHEIMHLLGRNHVDPALFPGTIMAPGGGSGPAEHILHPLDREALLAAYDRFEPDAAPGDIPVTLDGWSDTSLHVRAALGVAAGEVAFGAALRNGRSQPWALGPPPGSSLEATVRQSETAAWSGRLIGLTPHAQVVSGAADLSVELATLSGRVDFTGLESWPAHAAPGAIGTGRLWLDGDLHYTLELRGNTFVQTGGDSGTVTGVFYGPSHEGMGGVLERDDLSAGFGGSR